MGIRQTTFLDYEGFMAKFTPPKTTDDCYTPANVYEAVKAWVFRRYALDAGTEVVRPFWPGEDYEAHRYPEGCVVIDNPPFSIIGQIVQFFNANAVRYFLFAPYLTNIGIGRGTGCTHVITQTTIRYENGAEVGTSFVTNLDAENVAESAPDLAAEIEKADAENRAKLKTSLPKYDYPSEILTSAGLGYLAAHGVPFRVKKGDAAFVRKLDAQGEKAIFGGGLLLSERAAAERAAAERAAAERAAAERAAAHRWQLSDREVAIQKMLGREARNG